MAKMKIGLGMKVRDLISGFTGIVDHVCDYVNQGSVVAVQSIALDKDGAKMDSEMFDMTQLEILDSKPLFKIPESPEPLFKMGEKVRCKYTGYEGTVCGRAVYINGCARVYVQPLYDAKASVKNSKGDFLAEGSLESIAPPKEEPKKTSRGGPAPADSMRW